MSRLAFRSVGGVRLTPEQFVRVQDSQPILATLRPEGAGDDDAFERPEPRQSASAASRPPGRRVADRPRSMAASRPQEWL